MSGVKSVPYIQNGDLVYLRCRVLNIGTPNRTEPFVVPPVQLSIIDKAGNQYDPGAYMYAEAAWLILPGGAKAEILGESKA